MDNNSLYHHGIKGQRWGVRRYQNQNGTLTPAGKKRYAKNTTQSKAKEKPKELTTEEKKAKVVKDRSAKSFYANRKMFTYDETKAMRQLLQEDELIKKMIVEEPNKVKKFMDEVGDYAEKVKKIVVPVVDTLDKLSKLTGGSGTQVSTGNSKNNSGGNTNKNSGDNTNKNPTSSKEKTETFYPDDITDSPEVSSDGSTKRKKNQSNNVYDVPFTDIGKTTTAVSNLVTSVYGSYLNTSPAPSSSTTAFISDNVAGYLPAPKKED